MTGARSYGVCGRARVEDLRLRSAGGGRRRIKRRATSSVQVPTLRSFRLVRDYCRCERSTIRALPERVRRYGIWAATVQRLHTGPAPHTAQLCIALATELSTTSPG